eukprot:COSAG02_NODE_2926_length_7728_cov_3.194521_1_plen_273_part_10
MFLSLVTMCSPEQPDPEPEAMVVEPGPEPGALAARHKRRHGAPGAGECCICGVRPKVEEGTATQLRRHSSSAIEAVTRQRRQRLERMHEELRPLSAAELEAYCVELGVESRRLAKAREAEDPAGSLIKLAIAADSPFLACGPSPTAPPPASHLSPAGTHATSNGTGLELELVVDKSEKVWTASPPFWQPDNTFGALQVSSSVDPTSAEDTSHEEQDGQGHNQDWNRGSDSLSSSSSASSDTIVARQLRAESKRLGQTIVLQDIARAKAAGESF